jgi:plasmid maintenance system antidote protein VapI
MAFHPNNEHALLDYLIKNYKFKNDAALCRALGFYPPLISKIRSHKLEVSDSVILRIHEKLGMEVQLIRAFLNAAGQ